MTIGAQANFDYAEPVTVKHVSSNPHVDETSGARAIEQEDEGTEKPSKNFEEILAGLLNGVNQSADVSNAENGGFAADFEELKIDIQPGDLDLSGIALTEENENILLGAQTGLDDQLLAGFFDEMQAGLAAEEDARLRLPPSEINADDEAAALKNAANLFKNDKTEKDLSARAAAQSANELSASALKGGEEALAAENAAKKNRAAAENSADAAASAKNLSKADQVMSDNAHAVFAAKKSGEEGAFARNGKDELSQLGQREGKLDELRGRSRKDKITFEIRDQRTMADTASRSFTSVEASARGMADVPSSKEITLELRLPDYNNSGQASQTVWEVKASNAMENMLARELHNNFNGDIVRHASMALRDGGESTIRLALRPDSLGNVKIRLEMTDNKITGFIVVESEEALNAFRKEIAALEQAFKEAGFTDANLDLSLAQDGRNERQQSEENISSPQFAASGYEEAMREIESNTESMIDALLNGERQGSINMLA